MRGQGRIWRELQLEAEGMVVADLPVVVAVAAPGTPFSGHALARPTERAELERLVRRSQCGAETIFLGAFLPAAGGRKAVKVPALTEAQAAVL